MSQPPYEPYSHPQQPPSSYPYQPPSPYQQRSSGTSVALIVIGVIGLLVVLVCGGFVTVVVIGAKGISDAVEEFDSYQDRVGGPNNPITVEEGAAFAIDGIDYAEGWAVVRSDRATSTHTIIDLRGENDRDDGDGKFANIEFTFLIGNEEVGEIDCNSQGDISHGRSETLRCTSYGELQAGWEDIEVSAAY